MKPFTLCLLSLLGTVGAFSQSPGSTLSGLVRDSASGKPIPGVSVFLNSTSKGTVTHDDGSFVVSGIPPGRYELIVSAIGYATMQLEISTRHLPPVLKIALHTQASELAAVTVEPYLKNGWKKWGQLFWDNFIGTTANASSCSIKNKEVLRFRYYLKSRKLTVNAVEPLIITNKALGYNLEYRLESFSVDFTTNIISYYGYPFFREMPTGRQRPSAEMGQVTVRSRLPRLHDALLCEASTRAGCNRTGLSSNTRSSCSNIEKQRVKVRLYSQRHQDR
jgi:hypothetical protein